MFAGVTVEDLDVVGKAVVASLQQERTEREFNDEPWSSSYEPRAVDAVRVDARVTRGSQRPTVSCQYTAAIYT